MFAALGAAVLGLASMRPAEAHTPPRQADAWELYLTGGWLIPTGAQRAGIKGADLTALVVSYVPRPSFAVTGTFQWARSHALAIAGEPKLDIFTWDVGAETRGTPRSLGGAWTVAPFAGIGGGARTYNIPELPADPTWNLAAYGSAGGEFAIRRVHLRLEVRDYVSRFKPLTGGGKAATRNDVAVILGLRFVKKTA
ncbi:hypothetical protein [Geothrix sp. 21YS21S-2]|uniref:hypothetical protein n=1 Tax=Geothrix sp. 21YS21S-2 TaxID=3068893 RepID=UPI0027B96A36|nr:hypothetical protein [Geothrix sp. 21YS21S-2]